MSTTQPAETPAEIPAGIVARNVGRSFGAVRAVRDATLEARPGQVTALVGPNGSGKTTLLLILASLLRPDTGTVLVGGADPTVDTETVRAQLGWMPDALGSWNSLTVRSAIETTARLYRMDRATAAARANELITLVGLEPLAAQPTRTLSRGQKQKLSLARALVHDPQVLLLDEPASGLDPIARQELQVLLRRLASEGKTILVSSHVLAELDEVADTAVYLEGGVTASDDRIAQTRLSARPWRITSSDRDGLRSALIGAGVATADISEDRADLVVPVASEAAAVTLLAQLVRAGVPISAFAPAVGDLEHTFLDLNRTSGPAPGISIAGTPAASSPDEGQTR